VDEIRFYTPQEAEAAFYAAFMARDLEAMMAVWAQDDEIACVHPLGPVRFGRAEVRESWRAVFRHSPPMQFLIEERSRTQSEALAVHVVHEHIRVADTPPQPPVIATNVYRRTTQGWRMVLHHASPSPSPPPRQATQPQIVH
jgi:ketosteroid isomerase-like protein